MKNNYRKNIGSVSTATMRPEDLIPAFISELESMRPLRREHRKVLREIKRNIARMKNPAYYDSEQYQWDLDWLFDALNDYALPYFYFGAHPGDGSDYGFWLSEEFDQEFINLSGDNFEGAMLQDGDAIKVNEIADVPTGFTGEVLIVNERGNCSLYAYSRGHSREIWSIV